MSVVVEVIVALLLLVGAAFALLGSLGLLRFSSFFLRLHAPTKASTLGVGCILLASALWFSTRGSGISVHELLISAFLFLTAPVSAQLLAQAALRLHPELRRPTGSAEAGAPQRDD